jgi:hypothetical protein
VLSEATVVSRRLDSFFLIIIIIIITAKVYVTVVARQTTDVGMIAHAVSTFSPFNFGLIPEYSRR